jgi:TDG/mug DNA glycosylase family protein
MLKNIIAPSLRVVFCGTAAGRISAQKGQYYAHPQNSFWSILHEAGITPHRLQPSECERLIEFGVGLTDLAKNVSGMDQQLPKGSFGLHASNRLSQLIEKHSPRFLAFTSIAAGTLYFGSRRELGEQPEKIQRTRIWILPSTSPLAKRHWKKEVWLGFGDLLAPNGRGV